MLRLLPELVIAPILVGISTVACRRWGAQSGGLVSAFPAVVGPLLLIAAQEHGAVFAARTANGILLGLVGLAGFALAYARTALHGAWRASLFTGWLVSGILAAPIGWVAGGWSFPAGLVLATVSLGVAYVSMPECPAAPSASAQAVSWREIRLRMALTAMLVAALAGAAELFGALVGGVLAGLPVLASVLAGSTHRSDGPAAAVALLRGMLSGLAGFVSFCAVVAVLIVPAGTAPAFGLATATALVLQTPGLIRRPVRTQRCA